jgi:aerobic carbon-monoxide dehydrogenase medium subunit
MQHDRPVCARNSLVLPAEIGYARPASVAEALDLLASNEGARALAGGQTLVNVMKARAASPDAVIDLGALDELRGIELGGDGSLDIGAMTTISDLIESSEARARPIVGEVAAQIADVQVRNRGTIGGNICANDPTNHMPPLLVALGATMTIAGAGGERTVAADDFFLGVFMTAVGPGELLTRVHIPPGRRDGFASVTIGRDGTCILSAAVSLENGPRVALGCVDAVPRRAREVETKLNGDVKAAVEGLGDALDPPGDVHATAEYRRKVAEVVVARAIEQARSR